MARFEWTSPAAFRQALGFLLVANVLDASFTALWVSEGIVEEGNALMAAAIEQGYGVFVLSKVALVGLGAVGLFRLRDRLGARVAILPAVVLYAFVMGNHMGIGARVLGLVEQGIVFGGQLPGM